MDVELQDVEGPFSLVFTALLTVSRLIRSNQDAEKLGYDNWQGGMLHNRARFGNRRKCAKNPRQFLARMFNTFST